MISQEEREAALAVADALEKMAKLLRAATDSGDVFLCSYEMTAESREVWAGERFAGVVPVSTRSKYELRVGPSASTLRVDYTEFVSPRDQQREQTKLYARAGSR